MIGGFRGFSYGFPGRFGHQYPHPPDDGNWRLGCALMIGTVLAFILLTYPLSDNNVTKRSTIVPSTQEQHTELNKRVPDPQAMNVGKTRNSTKHMMSFLVIMAIAVMVWALIIYRYHNKFPILKHPDLKWRGPFRHP